MCVRFDLTCTSLSLLLLLLFYTIFFFSSLSFLCFYRLLFTSSYITSLCFFTCFFSPLFAFHFFHHFLALFPSFRPPISVARCLSVAPIHVPSHDDDDDDDDDGDQLSYWWTCGFWVSQLHTNPTTALLHNPARRYTHTFVWLYRIFHPLFVFW